MVAQQERTALPLLTTSRLKTARRCAREHDLRYNQGITSAEDAAALRIGTGVHLVLEAWWQAERDVRLQSALDALASYEWADEYERVRAEALIVGYHTRWDDASDAYDVLGVEAQFRAPLKNPETGGTSRTWELAGKIDVIVRERATGRVLVVEHKTTSEDCSPGSDYLKRLVLDGQVSMYFVGAETVVGAPVDGCLYDVIRKPGLRPYKATPEDQRKYTKAGALYANQRAEDETPDEFRARLFEAIAEDPVKYYARAEVVRLDGEVGEALFDVWQTARAMRDNELRGFHPRNPDACVRYGRTCEFWPVCAGQASIDDEHLYRRLDDVHPELSR